MKYAADLHVHSALSPCSDDDMTPNNIVNMSLLKGLDIIAVTDHNSAENLEAVSRCAALNGIVAIPGMELETSEEVHLICLFPTVDAALKMQETVYAALPPLENREDIFGRQMIMDEHDNIKGRLKRLLLTAAGFCLEDAFDLVKGLGGAVIPAHIDRDSYSILSNLGMIPEGLGIKYLELSKSCDFQEFIHKHPSLAGFQFIRSSDAHDLGTILERENFIELEERSIPCLIKKILQA